MVFVFRFNLYEFKLTSVDVDIINIFDKDSIKIELVPYNCPSNTICISHFIYIQQNPLSKMKTKNKISRTDFFKKICIGGSCICGFSTIAFSNNTSEAISQPDNNKQLAQSWITQLIANLEDELDSNTKRKVLKSCFSSHYKDLNMEKSLEPYYNNIEQFIVFLEEKWGWKITYKKETGILIADENKDFCVCPVIIQESELDKSAICYCSEGFAEKMFSVVAGYPVTATVTSSINRGDKHCVYEIDLKKPSSKNA